MGPSPIVTDGLTCSPTSPLATLAAMSATTHENHYVPQGLLRHWSADADRLEVHAYRIVVPRVDYPEWELRSISKVALLRDLYSSGADGREVDAFEHWVAERYETPGLGSIQRVVDEARLRPEDWVNLARLFAVQNLRTPANYTRFMDFCRREIEPVFSSTVQEAVSTFQRAQLPGNRALATISAEGELARSMRLQLTPAASDEPGEALLKVEMQADRSLWIGSIRHALGGIAAVLLRHRWEILMPHGNEEWPLTDNPALCVNWLGPGKFDLLGGWGTQKGDLLMPLSPRHLLHTEIGKRRSISRSTCSEVVTRDIQKILVAGALRWIFGYRPYGWVARARPRTVDLVRFAEDDRAIREWEQNQRPDVI